MSLIYAIVSASIWEWDFFKYNFIQQFKTLFYLLVSLSLRRVIHSTRLFENDTWNERISGGDSHINTPVSLLLHGLYLHSNAGTIIFPHSFPSLFLLGYFTTLRLLIHILKNMVFFLNANVIVFLKSPGKSWSELS